MSSSSTSPRKRLNRSRSISEATHNVNKESTESNGDCCQIIKKQEKVIPSYGTKTCHAARESLFSSTSGYGDYRGFLNLCVILLALSNARLFLENILKYGILVDPFQWINTAVQDPYRWPNLLLVIFSNVYILAAYYIERVLITKSFSETFGIVLHSLNLFCCLITPPVVVLSSEPNPFGSVFSCGCYVVVFLKLWSYAQANKWYRQDYLRKITTHKRIHRTKSTPNAKELADQSKDKVVEYPYNISYKNLYYFMLAPTLCYEPSYPRTEKIRRPFLFRRIVEVLFLIQLELAIVQQWIVPTLQKSILPIYNRDGGRTLERLLKLAIPNHFMWIIFFYWQFHSVLNVVAELLRFADREFYRDWWNAETIVYFWQAWNIPVHKWCARHLYKPLLNSGFNKFYAQLCVFIFSAIGHEYLVSIPLHLFKIWAFTGMLMQVPLVLLTNKMSKTMPGHYGNMIVWLSLILGQPIAILAYVYHYYSIHYAPDN